MVKIMRPFVALVAAFLPACIFYDAPPAHDPNGHIAFNWSFAGETDCARANVNDVNVIITDANTGEIVLDHEHEACTGGGLIFTDDFLEGPYQLDITAFDHNGVAEYSGTVVVNVVGGTTTDAGVVVLDAFGPPPPTEGSLAFFWSFLYPTDSRSEINCAVAGVDVVDVTITPEGSAGEPFTQTSVCDEQNQGLTIDHLNAGRYTLRLQAFGTYNGAQIMLYDSQDIVLDVLAGATTDKGSIDLHRVDAAFSDFDVSWNFPDSSCGSSVHTVTLSFQRDGFTGPEDSFDVDCSAAHVVRRTFVPGHYTVTGVASTYGASVPVDLAPSSVAQVDLALAPGG